LLRPERQMAFTNEQIGIAKAAYFPRCAYGLMEDLRLGSWRSGFSLPSGIWSVGPQAAETLFDAGRRRARFMSRKLLLNATVANYRQTVPHAFQQVEDNLAGAADSGERGSAEADAVGAAQNALDISTYQYKAGTVSYLSVITEQAILLQGQVQH